MLSFCAVGQGWMCVIEYLSVRFKLFDDFFIIIIFSIYVYVARYHSGIAAETTDILRTNTAGVYIYEKRFFFFVFLYVFLKSIFKIVCFFFFIVLVLTFILADKPRALYYYIYVICVHRHSINHRRL